MPKITKRIVEAAEVGDEDYIIFDSEIPGFEARILPSGKRSYLVQYRVGRKFRRMSLGLHGILTSEKARGEAIKVLGRVKDGEDPAGTSRSTRRRNGNATCRGRSWPGSAKPCGNASRKASRAGRRSTP